jgi:ABC-type multidrug transport system fused ATPase/permease subunit
MRGWLWLACLNRRPSPKPQALLLSLLDGRLQVGSNLSIIQPYWAMSWYVPLTVGCEVSQVLYQVTAAQQNAAPLVIPCWETEAVVYVGIGDLKFEDVSLRYFPGGPLALRHVSFHVQSCEKVSMRIHMYC